MGWEKEESHERTQESGYNVEVNAPPGLEFSDGLQPDLASEARGWVTL